MDYFIYTIGLVLSVIISCFIHALKKLCFNQSVHSSEKFKKIHINKTFRR